MTTDLRDIARRSAIELVGSAALSATVVGSGIAATNLSTDVGLQLLINALATACGLFVLITVLGPSSGAHFNPLVSLADSAFGLRGVRDVAPYVVAQVAGCIGGCVVASVMFDLPPMAWSTTDRATPGHFLAEIFATAGLIFVIFALVRSGRSHLAAPVVATYIGAAYFVTSSTSFANPAMTIGRMFTDSFAGISPGSVVPFISAQLIGAVLGYVAIRILAPAVAPGTESGQPAASRETFAPSAG